MSLINRIFILLALLYGVVLGVYTFGQKPQIVQVVTPAPKQEERSFFGQQDIDQQNFLINGGFDFMQWGEPVNGLAIDRLNHNNGHVNTFFSADRWTNYTTDVNGTAMVVKRSANSNSNASPYMLNVSQFDTGFPVGGHKVIFGQVVEHNWGLSLAGQNGNVVTFQVTFQSSTSTPIRMAIIEWTGTTDVVANTGYVQDFAHSADADVSVTGSGHFFTTNCTVHQDAGSTSITTKKTLSLTATVSPSVHNIICVFWETTAVGVGNNWNVYEAGLYPGPNGHPAWRPRNPGAELTLCQRYMEKSYDVDVEPGTAFANETAIVINGGSTSIQHFWIFPMHTSKCKASPSATGFSSVGGIDGRGDLIDGSLVYTPISAVTTSATSNFVIIQDSSANTSAGIGANWVVDSEL